MIDESVIKKLEELEAKATPGPWDCFFSSYDEIYSGVPNSDNQFQITKNDSDLILLLMKNAKVFLEAAKENIRLKKALEKIHSEPVPGTRFIDAHNFIDTLRNIAREALNAQVGSWEYCEKE